MASKGRYMSMPRIVLAFPTSANPLYRMANHYRTPPRLLTTETTKKNLSNVNHHVSLPSLDEKPSAPPVDTCFMRLFSAEFFLLSEPPSLHGPLSVRTYLPDRRISAPEW